VSGRPPLVSVVLCVHDAEPYLRASMASVLGQTMGDLELIVVDDGSTDASLAVARDVDDPRVRVIPLAHGGLAVALATGAGAARGRYLARQDADDRSRPDRLARQLEAVEARPDAVVAGCGFALVDVHGRELGTIVPPVADADLRRRMLVRNPFAGGSVLALRAAVEEVGLPDSGNAEDYELLERLGRVGRLTSAPEVLYDWRVVPTSVSHRRVREQQRNAALVQERLWRSPPPVRRRPELRAGLADAAGRGAVGRARRASYVRTELMVAVQMARRRRRRDALRQVSSVAALGPAAWAALAADLPGRLRNRHSS
jgi:hypothetical protein